MINLSKTALKFIHRNADKIIGAVAVIAVISFIVSVTTSVVYFKPKLTKDFARTSVQVVDKNMQTGGSGVILNSNIFSSEVLTNKHVCRLLEGGGYVIHNGVAYLAGAIKRYPTHDLCLVKVHYNFGVSTKVADSRPTNFSDALISGHPNLLPHVLTRGSFSGRQIINLMVGLKPCTTEDQQGEMRGYCMWFGGIPIIQSFESQLVTGTILPGSSGSGVFTTEGEISGLVFAGHSKGFSYAFIVPHSYVVDFINNKDKYEWVEVTKTSYDDLIRRIFNIQEVCETPKKKERIKPLCENVTDYMIWRR